ncbi:iron ABC transporter permease [Pseudonocardiaceae bacterium YIM PH 21723]|nr:iron ABC transporter permease [Pseudonocardiaceae bacterium YIM PH 21723]
MKRGLLLLGLLIALVASCLVGVSLGAFQISVPDVLRLLHLLPGQGPGALADQVLWQVRIPRVLLAVLVGATLGCAGGLMQGVFGNPLAEPGVVGISVGAAVGAAVAILIGLTALGAWTQTIAAFAGGLITVFLVYFLARNNGRTEVVTLVLTGIAVNAFCGAILGLTMFLSTDSQLRAITFWNLGSVGQATWSSVAAVFPFALAGLIAAPVFARKLDLLALGERPARHLGVNVERLRIQAILVIALLTAAAVAVSGVLLFMGLVVPHLVRMVFGPGHRYLLLGSAVTGAVILVLADLAARTLVAPAEIPLGVFTSLLGSPVFFWLLVRTRAKQGGWA